MRHVVRVRVLWRGNTMVRTDGDGACDSDARVCKRGPGMSAHSAYIDQIIAKSHA